MTRLNSGLGPAAAHLLLQRTLFLTRESRPVSRPPLARLATAAPPQYSNSSLAWQAAVLAAISQMEVRILVWNSSLPLTTSPLQLLEGGAGGGADLVAGRCGDQTAPSLDLLLLEPRLPAYNLLLHLQNRQSGFPAPRPFSPSSEDCVRRLVRELQSQHFTQFPLAWQWGPSNLCSG